MCFHMADMAIGLVAPLTVETLGMTFLYDYQTLTAYVFTYLTLFQQVVNFDLQGRVE